MNPNGIEGGNGGGHHPHGHHPPPDHHGHPQYYDPQGQYPNYGSYPNYPYAYFHHEGGPPPPHQYHDGQYFPPPHPYYDPYGMDPQHNIKVDSEQYYQGLPHHDYRIDDGHERQVQMQEHVVPQEKITESIIEQAAEHQQPSEMEHEQVKKVRVDQTEEPAHVSAQTEAQAELREEILEQEKEEVEAHADEPVIREESSDLPEGKVFQFEDVFKELQNFKSKHGHANIPLNHSSFAKIINALVNNGIEKEADRQWERKFNIIKEYKDKHGDCGIPYNDPNMGEWMALHRKLKADGVSDPVTVSRLAKLESIGFEWDITVWDSRLQELAEFTKHHNHTDVPITHPGGLGVWVINQKFNLNEMPKERIAALDSLDFIWNHNRKRRNNKNWDERYEELKEYIAKHGTVNVPTTQGHSKLSKWVGKQREEYKKFNNKQSSQLDRVRIEKLEKIGFQWSIQTWKNVPWEERFEELKKFKEEYGHLKIPRSHPYFGNWPNWQRTQYKLYLSGKGGKITKDKVEKLIAIGFLKAPTDKD